MNRQRLGLVQTSAKVRKGRLHMSEYNVVQERLPYEPWVTLCDEESTYHLPVEGSFVSKLFAFPITKRHLSILEIDPERFYFLFAVLHRVYRLKSSAVALDVDEKFDQILCEPQPLVVRLLDRADAENNRAISAHVSKLTGRDLESL